MAGKIKADRIYVITIKSKLLQEFPYELVELFHPQHIKKNSPQSLSAFVK